MILLKADVKNASPNDDGHKLHLIRNELVPFLANRPNLDISLVDYSRINRVEVIDWKTGGGRVFSHWEDNSKITLELQDDNRTLKVFIEER